jgi:excisionase family DNA binding protein
LSEQTPALAAFMDLVRGAMSSQVESLASAAEALRSAADTPPPRLSEKLTLSLMEAAQLSGLSRRILRQAIEEKKLKARIIGRGWRVKRADLDAYVTKL